ncbi:MAG: hypothetical protein FWB72_00085 [Firmicutes bacterium]|nr:hypothetical protein [Bacillota bacterium]
MSNKINKGNKSQSENQTENLVLPEIGQETDTAEMQDIEGGSRNAAKWIAAGTAMAGLAVAAGGMIFGGTSGGAAAEVTALSKGGNKSKSGLPTPDINAFQSYERNGTQLISLAGADFWTLKSDLIDGSTNPDYTREWLAQATPVNQ